MTEEKTRSSLATLIDTTRTDKHQTGHNYLATYEKLFAPMRDRAKNVGEIGIDKGGSIKLWNDYFPNARIIGIDIMPKASVWPALLEEKRVELHTATNAYDLAFIEKEFRAKGILFDVIIDDGPHTLESMHHFIQLYGPLLSDTGILVVEDLQSIDWVDSLKGSVPKELQGCIEVYDLRKIQNRWDDILFVVNKNNK